jgi:hypothetical protein
MKHRGRADVFSYEATNVLGHPQVLTDPVIRHILVGIIRHVSRLDSSGPLFSFV